MCTFSMVICAWKYSAPLNGLLPIIYKWKGMIRTMSWFYIYSTIKPMEKKQAKVFKDNEKLSDRYHK
jgi:hypothetical protein